MRKQDSFGLFKCPRLEAGRHKAREISHHPAQRPQPDHQSHRRVEGKYLLWKCLEGAHSQNEGTDQKTGKPGPQKQELHPRNPQVLKK